MNGNKVFLTDKKTGDKACVEMLNSATIKVSYSNGKEETFDTKGNLISYNYGAQAPSMKSLNKKKNKFFSKEGFVLGDNSVINFMHCNAIYVPWHKR